MIAITIKIYEGEVLGQTFLHLLKRIKKEEDWNRALLKAASQQLTQNPAPLFVILYMTVRAYLHIYYR